MHENPTRYIKHLAGSADFKGGTINKHRNGLIGNRFEMPNVSYTHPLATSLKRSGDNYRLIEKQKSNTPTHKAKVWQPFLQASLRSQTLASLPPHPLRR